MHIKETDVENLSSDILKQYFRRLKHEYSVCANVNVEGILIDYSPREIVLIELIEKLIKESEERIIKGLRK